MKNITESINRITTKDTAVLLLRIGAAICIFPKHGFEKIVDFTTMKETFPDPIHIGGLLSFLFAFFSDSICSLLVAVGLFTRVAASVLIVNLFVAFCFFWHGAILNVDGEVALLYLFVYSSVFLSGPEKYSLDAIIKRRTYNISK